MLKNKIQLKYFILFCVLLINLFSFSNIYYCVTLPIIIIIFSFITISKWNYFKRYFYRSKELKLLFCFIIAALFCYIANCFHADLTKFTLSLFITYIPSIVLCFLIGLQISLIYKSKQIIKLMILSLYLILCFGLLEFILSVLHIEIINSIIDFTSGYTNTSISYKAGNIPRIQSLFHEPSHYAWFLVCNIPLAFKIFKTKYLLFRNNWINFIIKKSLSPILLLSLFLTQSPINIILGVLVILFIMKIRIKRFLIIIVPLLLILITCLSVFDSSEIDISNSFLSRIVNTVNNFRNFEDFIIIESSLATRIVSYINMFIIYLQHPLFGLSCGQLSIAFPKQLEYSPVPLTIELLSVIRTANSVYFVNPSIFFKVAVDMGTLGLILFYRFLSNLLNKYKKIVKYMQGLQKDFVLGVIYTLYVYIILTFYDSQIDCKYFWVLFGATYGIYIKEKINGRCINNICKL